MHFSPHMSPSHILEANKTSPVTAFLSDPANATCSTATAFVGRNTGFLPPFGLPPLPHSLAALQNAANSLPQVTRDDTWSAYISTVPDVTEIVKNVPEKHLLRSNQALGFIAHTINFFGQCQPPSHLVAAWEVTSSRLSRPFTSLITLDFAIYNFEFKSSHTSGTFPTKEHITDASSAWNDLRMVVSATGTSTERSFISTTVSIELAAKRLPGLIAEVHDAVVAGRTGDIRNALLPILEVTRAMAAAFISSDVRPLSLTYLDHVEFMRVLDVFAMPAIPGEKTGSGTLFPSVHLLDFFLSRDHYETKVGKLVEEERKLLPALHKRFYDAVSQVSLFSYVEQLPPSRQKQEIFLALQTIQNSFAAEHGMLGKHRLRIVTFLEIGMKVGRLSTNSGNKSSRWQMRLWERIDASMKLSMQERMSHVRNAYTATQSLKCRRISNSKGGTYEVTLNAPGISVYRPGDRVAILPENHDELVDRTLEALDISGDSKIFVRSEQWLQALRERDDRKSPTSYEGKDRVLTARQFLKIAKLQPLDEALGKRIAHAMYVTNAAMLTYLSEERASNVPIALELVKRFAHHSAIHLLPRLEQILEPLQPRTYSIVSHPNQSSDELSIIVGKMHFKANNKLSFRYDPPTWRKKNASLRPLNVKDADVYLSNFQETPLFPIRTGTHELNDVHGAKSDNIAPNQDEISRPELFSNNQFETSPCLFFEGQSQPKSAKLACDFLCREHRNGLRINAKAISRAQLIVAANEHKDDEVLEGICSRYLTNAQPGENVRLRLVESGDFHLPGDESTPIVMFALGSGVAPYRAFMYDIRQKRGAKVSRKAWLILGVRTQNDILFRDEIEELVCGPDAAMDLSVAISGEDIQLRESRKHNKLKFYSGKRSHIQQLMSTEENSRRLWDFLQRGSHLYICGHPELECVTREIVRCCAAQFIRSNHGDSPKIYADRLVAERRVHIDTYFSGEQFDSSRSHKLFEYSDVALHASVSSCWTVFRGSVFDVTDFLHVHPGGGKILLDNGGRDMTRSFDLAHGADNVRVAGMLQPYRIGSIEKYKNASVQVLELLKRWAVPALHDMLETRSVWELTVNQFEGLMEPREFTDWKSPAHTLSGRRLIEQKWWYQHEPDMFSVLTGLFHTTSRGKLMGRLAHEAGVTLDTSRVIQDLNTVREQSREGGRVEPPAELSEAQLTTALEEKRKMAWRFVLVIQHVVVAVENAVRRSSEGHELHNVALVLCADVIRTVLRETRRLYGCVQTP